METQLSKIANLNDAAVATFEAFAHRQRFRGQTNISRFQRELETKFGKPIDEKELLEMFKSLDKAGMGSLILGRLRSQTRFIWNYSLKDVARAARGELDQVHMHRINAKPVTRSRVIRRPYKPLETRQLPVVVGDTEEVIIIKGNEITKLDIPKNKAEVFTKMVKVFEK